MIESPCFSIFSIWCYCFGFWPCNRCIMIFHCLNLQLPDKLSDLAAMTYDIEHLFMFTCHLCIFGKVSVHIFCPSFSWVVRFFCCWIFTFCIQVLDQKSAWKIFFSQFVAYIFILLTVSQSRKFIEQKILILIKFKYFFHELCFWVVSKSSLSSSRPPRFSPMSFSRSFIVLCFTVRCVIKF